MNTEGWFVDPFGNHEARWISSDTPTALVRDGKIESQDPPPDSHYSGPYTRIAQEGASNGDDLHHADDAESGSSRRDYGRAGAEALNGTGFLNF
jgi:hypothetical protein